MNGILFVCTFIFLSAGAQPAPETSVEGGRVKGYSTASGVKVFKGIPFAAPPVGELRWKAPQPVATWKGTRDCSRFSASPMQAAPFPFMYWSQEFLIPKEPISEDCLYLNVWTNAASNKEKRPVLVYIYGGGFVSGGSACPIYDGEAMAKKGVVFVSINYRVGVFGFLALPELTRESGTHSSGNYALLDMIAALKWVKRNISRFGGDPEEVTIAGQSAGAFGVNFLTASPLAKGLFHRAIAESGGSFVTAGMDFNTSLESAEKKGQQFAEKLKCKSLAELRSKTSAEILKAAVPITPFIDGYVLPKTVYEIYENGEQNDVPVLLGWNKDDGIVMGAAKSDSFNQQIRKRFGDMADEFLKWYPSGTEEESVRSQKAMSRDETFGIQGYYWAMMQSAGGKSPVYVYNFNHDLPAGTPETQFGAFHSGEIVYMYNNLDKLNRPWEKSDYRLADQLSSYLVNFAKTGNPNGDELPEWVPFKNENKKVLIIAQNCFSESLPNEEQYLVWEKFLDGKKPK